MSRHSLTSAHHADVPACLSLEICVDYFQQTVETCGAVAIRDLWRYNATHDGPAREDANAAGCTQDHPSATPSSGGRCVFEEALLSAEAQRLIAGHARVAAYKSFFLFYAMHLVHMPLQIPTAYERNFSFIDDPYVSPPRPLPSGGAKRAGTSLYTNKMFTKGRSIFGRSTENGPAFP